MENKVDSAIVQLKSALLDEMIANMTGKSSGRKAKVGSRKKRKVPLTTKSGKPDKRFKKKK